MPDRRKFCAAGGGTHLLTKKWGRKRLLPKTTKKAKLIITLDGNISVPSDLPKTWGVLPQRIRQLQGSVDKQRNMPEYQHVERVCRWAQRAAA
jgi:hypothetical protein